MSEHAKIFVASSTEALTAGVGDKVEEAVRTRLRDRSTEFELWTRAFDLSKTYIESLEKVIAEVDFAILIVTPDDRTISRHKRTASPRDNVIFELGMFIGSLGRDRCFVLKEASADLKLPTDLLGVHVAIFSIGIFRLQSMHAFSRSLNESTSRRSDLAFPRKS